MPTVKHPLEFHPFFMSTLIRYIVIICLAAGSFARAATADEPKEKFVRVAIMDNIDELNFSGRGKYQIIDPKSGGILEEGRSSRRFTLFPSPQGASGRGGGASGRSAGIRINDEEYTLQKIRLTAAKDITIYVGDTAKRYRGALDVIQKTNKKFLIVNIIELEQYIRGVLYHEVSHRWPMEAMKAQAVAARTYALYQMKKNKKEEYDVTGDIYSQVYGGKSAERFRTNIAVKRTQGKILVYAGKMLPAYFHASCGGHTENARNIWGEDLPPLSGVPCPFCALAPHSIWRKNYRLKDIQDKLNAHGYPIGPIQEIRVVSRNESGRVNSLMFISRDGMDTTIPGIKFREIIGPNVIKSNNYQIVMKGYYFDLIGKGWGHGVGMCQWGAHRMAQERYRDDEILLFYYPGSKIVDYREHPPADLP